MVIKMNDKSNSHTIKKKLRKTNFVFEGLSLIRIVLISMIVFLIAINCLIRPTYINGNSMYPFLEDGQIGITNVIGVYIGDIERFDVVTVYDHVEEKNLAKRVIGLPKETLEYRNGTLYINGEIVEEDFLDDDYVNEQTNNGSIPFTSNYGPIELGDDEYFLCGDNRRVSRDSRELGPFEKSEIISKDFLVVFN